MHASAGDTRANVVASPDESITPVDSSAIGGPMNTGRMNERETGGAQTLASFGNALWENRRVIDDRRTRGDTGQRGLERRIDRGIVAQAKVQAFGAACRLGGIGERERAVGLQCLRSLEGAIPNSHADTAPAHRADHCRAEHPGSIKCDRFHTRKQSRKTGNGCESGDICRCSEVPTRDPSPAGRHSGARLARAAEPARRVVRFQGRQRRRRHHLVAAPAASTGRWHSC